MIRSMDVDCVPYRKTGYFSKLINDYLDENEKLRPFYNRFPEIKAFKAQIEEKKASYPMEFRDILADAIQNQYGELELSEQTSDHINALRETTTFTVVTGHQLNLFTGPLYFLYKIISTINLCTELSEAYPKNRFVPVYWMATEDHDFDEINYFNFRGKKIAWNRDCSGAVGRLNTEGLEAVYEAFKSLVGKNRQAKELLRLFENAYLKNEDLTSATRELANQLFADYGLVIVDGDDMRLKKLMVPYIKKDIFEKVSYEAVSHTIEEFNSLKSEYKVQVNPREINYFYLRDSLRDRIVEKDGQFEILNTDIRFSKGEMEVEIENHPERFSPNVITRPVYQEVVLPNLCYIGGGGEIAYWLELKSSFEAYGIPFPVLLLRNSALIVSVKQDKKLGNLNISHEDVFMKQNNLINKKIREISNINIDLSPQKKLLQEQFGGLYKIAELTDKSFLGAVKAQEKKQLNGVDHLEKRLLKAQKKKLKDQVIRMTDLQNELFPGRSLQERVLNFSEIYLELGPDLIPSLISSLKPLDLRFAVLIY